MALRFSKQAETALTRIFTSDLDGQVLDRLTRRLKYLEDHATALEAWEEYVVLSHEEVPGAGALKAYVLEADKGRVFTIAYRLATDGSEDVWIVGLVGPTV